MPGIRAGQTGAALCPAPRQSKLYTMTGVGEQEKNNKD